MADMPWYDMPGQTLGDMVRRIEEIAPASRKYKAAEVFKYPSYTAYLESRTTPEKTAYWKKKFKETGLGRGKELFTSDRGGIRWKPWKGVDYPDYSFTEDFNMAYARAKKLGHKVFWFNEKPYTVE